MKTKWIVHIRHRMGPHPNNCMGPHPNNWEGWIFTDTDAIKTKGRLGSDTNPSTPLIISPATERLLEAKRSDNTEFLVIDHEGNFTVNGKKDFTKEELKTAIIEMVRLMSKILGINVYAGNLKVSQMDKEKKA